MLVDCFYKMLSHGYFEAIIDDDNMLFDLSVFHSYLRASRSCVLTPIIHDDVEKEARKNAARLGEHIRNKLILRPVRFGTGSSASVRVAPPAPEGARQGGEGEERDAVQALQQLVAEPMLSQSPQQAEVEPAAAVNAEPARERGSAMAPSPQQELVNKEPAVVVKTESNQETDSYSSEYESETEQSAGKGEEEAAAGEEEAEAAGEMEEAGEMEAEAAGEMEEAGEIKAEAAGEMDEAGEMEAEAAGEEEEEVGDQAAAGEEEEEAGDQAAAGEEEAPRPARCPCHGPGCADRHPPSLKRRGAGRRRRRIRHAQQHARTRPGSTRPATPETLACTWALAAFPWNQWWPVQPTVSIAMMGRALRIGLTFCTETCP